MFDIKFRWLENNIEIYTEIHIENKILWFKTHL
jgi:hypothetical protein